MMDIKIIGSSSAGNCTIIDNFLMVDFGLHKDILAPYLDSVLYVFCTHRHGDHYNSSIVNYWKKNRPALYRNGLIFNEDCSKLAGISPTEKREFNKISIGDTNYEYYLFPVMHDVECQGLTLYKENTNELLFYATDLAKLPENKDIQSVFKRYNKDSFDYILLEGNYDKNTLLEALMDMEMEDRAIRNLRHLSNEKWKLFTDAYGNDNTECYQMHMSEMFGKKID